MEGGRELGRKVGVVRMRRDRGDVGVGKRWTGVMNDYYKGKTE